MITRRNFLVTVSALAVTPALPAAPIEVPTWKPAFYGIVDRVDRYPPRAGGGIPGIYRWGPRYTGTSRERPGHNPARPKQ